MELSIQYFLGDGKPVSSSGSISLPGSIFSADWNMPLVHQVITAYQAAARAGTKQNKSRGDVRGGGKKPWRQKGTGRARAGTSTSPLWRTGGVTFAARPRDYTQKVNRKMYRNAIMSMFSKHCMDENIRVIETNPFESFKTSVFVKGMEALDLTGKLYFIMDDVDTNFALASRNVPKIHLTNVANIDPVSLYRADTVIIAPQAMKKLEEWLS